VAKHELAALYRHARAVLFPSRYEGFGIPVVEALASGCALFISNQPALLEVAAGNAAVIELDADSILSALTSDSDRDGRRSRVDGSGCDRTWAQCVSRLVQAMQ
jgi:glycosyltransferase involved in cell wall biosynthesis